jgi:hypothetical protein
MPQAGEGKPLPLPSCAQPTAARTSSCSAARAAAAPGSAPSPVTRSLHPFAATTSIQEACKASRSRCTASSFALRLPRRQAYWPFHRAACRRNEFADAIEASEPAFAAWMRRHGKQAVLGDGAQPRTAPRAPPRPLRARSPRARPHPSTPKRNTRSCEHVRASMCAHVLPRDSGPQPRWTGWSARRGRCWAPGARRSWAACTAAWTRSRKVGPRACLKEPWRGGELGSEAVLCTRQRRRRRLVAWAAAGAVRAR